MNLAEIGENPLNKVHGIGPLRVSCQLGFCPLRRYRRWIGVWLIAHSEGGGCPRLIVWMGEGRGKWRSVRETQGASDESRLTVA
jgi:hypothetical protein